MEANEAPAKPARATDSDGTGGAIAGPTAIGPVSGHPVSGPRVSGVGRDGEDATDSPAAGTPVSRAPVSTDSAPIGPVSGGADSGDSVSGGPSVERPLSEGVSSGGARPDESVARPHTGRRRNEAVRRAILDAALLLLAESGGAPVTVEAVARAAGVGKQTLYRWWPSKGAVLLDALTDRADQDVPPPDTGSLRDDLCAVIATTFDVAQRAPWAPALRTLVHEAAADPHLAELLRTYTGTRRALLRGVLDRGRGRGELPAGRDLDLMVDQVYGLFWYRFLLGHAPLDRATAERLTDSLLGNDGQ